LHGHDITVTSRQDLNLLDLSQVTQCLQDQKFDWIINCAVTGRSNVHNSDQNTLSENLVMFTNLYANLDAVANGMITFGSGAEFDVEKDIDQASEISIWQHMPTHSYGLGKNLISRMSGLHPKSYVVRIFGCFDSEEDSIRPIKKLTHCIQKQTPFILEKDRWFDMISVVDLVKIVQYVITGACGFRDINAVYNHKARLSDILRVYCELHGHDSNYVHFHELLVYQQVHVSYSSFLLTW
jgi:dTDP-4-dehydrorhamnose reductase